MRAVVQRVSQAAVSVDEQVIGQIERGLVVLLGVDVDDDDRDVAFMADKLVGLRIFDDAAGKMNLSVIDVAGDILLISQFTLLADTRKGRRPSYLRAAPPAKAEALYEQVAAALRPHLRVATGRFQAHMLVTLTNDGPVTIVLESRTTD